MRAAILAATLVGYLASIVPAGARSRCVLGQIWRPSIGTCQSRAVAARAGVYKRQRQARHARPRTRVVVIRKVVVVTRVAAAPEPAQSPVRSYDTTGSLSLNPLPKWERR